MPRKETVPMKPERVILLIAGESGSGKSFFVANLKNALIFDTDIGGGLSYADARIARNGSERIEVGSYLDVEAELRRRWRELGDFTTIAIDHLSTLQQEAVNRHNPNLAEGTFGREYDRANKEWRRIRDMARRGDFHLVCTSHMKTRYENNKASGVAPDASKNIEGDFSMVLYVRKGSGYPSQAHVQKWRRDPEDARGRIPATIPLTVEKFVEAHGHPFEGARQEVPMATANQIAEIKLLIDVVKLPEGEIERWFAKAKADSWEEFTAADLQKCIDHLNGKLGKSKKEDAA